MYSIFYGPRRKKADISLSVNTIVIVVLAITILGLGLNFIRSTVGGALGRTGDLIDTIDLDKKPTAYEPITIDEKITITRNGDITKKIGFYNKGDSELSEVKPMIRTCLSIADGEDADPMPIIVVPSKSTLGSSESTGYLATIKVEDLPVGKYNCVLAMEGSPEISDEKSFILEVTA